MRKIGWTYLLAAGGLCIAGGIAACGGDDSEGDNIIGGNGSNGGADGGVNGTGGSGGSGGGTNGGTNGGADGFCHNKSDAPVSCAADCGREGTDDCACEGACCPTNDSCFLDNGVGDECLAKRDNSKDATDRVQYRLTWARSTAPAGNTIDIVYQVLSNGAGLPNPDCNQVGGTSGFIQLLDLDLSDPELTNHTSTVGYAPWVPEGEVQTTIDEGLCMLEDTYDNADWRLPADQMQPTDGWPEGLPDPMPLPWEVKPTVAKRLEEDFDISNEETRQELLTMIANDDSMDGVFYLDDETGISHGYSPQAWVVVYTSPDSFISIPIREAETWYQTNDPDERSCIGAFRAGEINESTCTSADQENPPWGCINDEQCMGGEAPGKVSGYFLITELEQVFSDVLQSTLCVSYPTQAVAEEDGFAGDWGNNCRGSDKWDPAAGSSGLPTGDWCAATNEPATDECHDAFRSITFQTYQGFPIKDASCNFQGQ